MAPALFTDTAPEMRINQGRDLRARGSVIRVKNYEEALASRTRRRSACRRES